MKRKGIIGSLLAVVGVIIVVFSFSSRINRFMEMHVDRSRNNAQAIDRNIVEVFEDIEANLQYIIYKPHFERMEHFYNETGDISQLARKVKDGEIDPDAIDMELFESELYTADLPEVDFMIRTSGEIRLSNFLLYQLAYAEFYQTDVLWPDFDKKAYDEALLAYTKRNRRFGGV